MTDLLQETAEEIYYAIAKHITDIEEREDPEYITAYRLMEEIEDLDVIGRVLDEKLRIGEE